MVGWWVNLGYTQTRQCAKETQKRKGNTSAGDAGRKEGRKGGWVQTRCCSTKSQASQVGTAMDKKTDHHLKKFRRHSKGRERERERFLLDG
jgi:hypothetical protein